MKNAVLDGTEDVVLSQLLEITRASIRLERPVFSNLVEEPTFYRRHFVRWVREAMDERDVTTQAIKDELANAFK